MESADEYYVEVKWCRGWESNPYSPRGGVDVESLMSTLRAGEASHVTDEKDPPLHLEALPAHRWMNWDASVNIRRVA